MREGKGHKLCKIGEGWASRPGNVNAGLAKRTHWEDAETMQDCSRIAKLQKKKKG